MKYLFGIILSLSFASVSLAQPYYNNLAFASYFGGSNDDIIEDVAIDSSGYIFILGHTSSTDIDYPNPMQSSYHGGLSDVFIARLSPDAHQVLGFAYFGGSNRDEGRSIAIRPDQKVVITGVTDSKLLPNSSFAFKSTRNKKTEGFVALLENDLSAVLVSSFTGVAFGGFDMEFLPLLVEPDNEIILAQSTTANPGFDFQAVHSPNPFSNVMILRINEYLSNVREGSFWGGDSYDYVSDIMWMEQESAWYLCGWTASDSLPASAGALQDSNRGSYDAYIARLGSGFVNEKNTFFGGASFDKAVRIISLPDGRLMLSGTSYSDTFATGFAGMRDTLGPNISDLFLARFNTELTELSAFTYIGGENIEYLNDAFSDTKGNVFVLGSTLSNQFPVTWNSFDKDFGSPEEGYALLINPDLTEILSSSFVGDSLSDAVEAGIMSPLGGVVQVGYTLSSRFTLTPEAFDTILDGRSDAFVVVSNVYSVGIESGAGTGNEIAMIIAGQELLFDIPEGSWSLRVFDLSGREIYSEELGRLSPGKYRKSLPSWMKGFCIVELRSRETRAVKKAFLGVN